MTPALIICWRHTVPTLTPDGNTMIEIFKFVSDRENIGPFVRGILRLRMVAGGLSQAPAATL